MTAAERSPSPLHIPPIHTSIHPPIHRRVVVTVAVILESAVGGLVLKSGLRILATCTAGLLGVG